jgi:hypothetical protein
MDSFLRREGCGGLIVFPSVDTVIHVGGVMGAMFLGQCEWGENFGMQYAGAHGPLSLPFARGPLKSICNTMNVGNATENVNLRYFNSRYFQDIPFIQLNFMLVSWRRCPNRAGVSFCIRGI